ncbi:hypothetical protein Strain138_002351 [Pseudogemmatithrix spongiicola]|uniref:Pilus assembly protein PilP n=1 Tax=Pseudogemmatithrix spongiicola TaxID=3062599 RepID=A0AA49JWD8_9BACT|nr:hypothetical protein Strain138_002351 [Gemmatimonadaceae bacterium 'strain 138']WKW15943.1 hypothetical protein Strain318_002350 [Gemmatimonadaceae bacterium 'strain 318']
MNRRILAIAAVLVAVAVPMLGGAQGGRRPAAAASARVEVPTDGLKRDSAGNVIFNREVYSYPLSGRRDPFSSLIESGDIRPMLQDLEVVAITLAPTDRQSIATLRDVSSSEIYRVRVGSVFGRMRVVAIRQREVVLAIDEFGNTRQETLSINVSAGGGRTP